MAPRKKSKPNPPAEREFDSVPKVSPASNQETAKATPASNPPNETTPIIPSSGSATAASALNDKEPSVDKKSGNKWLSGGSWRSKASATVKTASQSIGISVSGGAASELPNEEAKTSKDQSPAKFLTKRKSSKGDGIPAAMTKLNVSSDGSIDQQAEQKPEEAQNEIPPSTDEPPLPPNPLSSDAAQQASTWGWRSWWSRPDGYTEPSKASGPINNLADAQGTPLPGVTPSEEADVSTKELGLATQEHDQTDKDVIMNDAPAETAQDQRDIDMKDAPKLGGPAARSSWFWYWSNKENAPAQPPSTTASTTNETATKSNAPSEEAAEIQNLPSSEPDEPTEPEEVIKAPPQKDAASSAAPKQQSTASGWAFWFKSEPRSEASADGGVAHKVVGQLAVADSPSETHPEPAQFNEEEQPSAEASKSPEQSQAEEPVPKRSFMSLRGRPKAKATKKETTADTTSTDKATIPSNKSPSPSPTRPETATSAKTQPLPKDPSKAKQELSNLVLPEFQNTYQLVQQPSFWQQLKVYLLGNETAQPHLHINPAPPRVKKAVAIGVHGFFPSPIFRKVIGEPKGTSVRFATAAAEAIRDWCGERGYEPEIKNIALEGEGFIHARVKALWTLLLNDINLLKSADFILIACHSQGVPVAIMLTAKLIQFGCISSARIGICAMAGINMGPFIEYKTKALGPIAAELFEFGNPNSLVSQMYRAALDEILRFGVRVTYVGSIDDQLVSLESSTFSAVSHPYIYRTVFVDGRLHAPDFLTHLVGFVLKLRNLGLPDHGLIRELSPQLAGSLYGGEGHSRVYEDPRVYKLATQHTLETTSLPIAPQQARINAAASFAGINIPTPGAKFDRKDVYKMMVRDYKGAGSGEANPYFLPWAMRGLLEEDFVKKELGREVEELLAMFEEWKPTDKRLKDVKFRLEGVRSKL